MDMEQKTDTKIVALEKEETHLQGGRKDMRLFIAAEFDEQSKQKIWEIASKLEEKCIKGSFSRKGNFHLTLAFLGETEKNKVGAIMEILETIPAQPMALECTGLGRFRRNGDIYWIGTRPYPPIQKIHEKIQKDLENVGFSLEQRPFIPHITLARRAVPKENFIKKELDELAAGLRIPIKAITLMQSSRIKGRLVYTPVYRKKLKDESHSSY